MLRRCGTGFGTLGLATLLSEVSARAADEGNPLAAKPPHFPARAKYVIQILANGGPAQMDTFDPKPELTKYHGQRLPIHLETERPTSTALARRSSSRATGTVWHGSEANSSPRSPNSIGRPVCDPLDAHGHAHSRELAAADELRREHHGAAEHRRVDHLRPRHRESESAGLRRARPKGMPVAGAVTAVVVSAGGYQGTYIETQDKKVDQLIEICTTRCSQAMSSRRSSASSNDLIASTFADAHDPALEARIQSFETRFVCRPRRPMPSTSNASPSTSAGFTGDTAAGESRCSSRAACRARRAFRASLAPGIAAAVGQPQPTIEPEHRKLARESCQGTQRAAHHLKSRGLLDETLVIWGGEFGGRRRSINPGREKVSPTAGRDHNNHGFTMWLAGAGVKGETIYGATDEFVSRGGKSRPRFTDLQATVLHLLGLDHVAARLSPLSGRDFPPDRRGRARREGSSRP